MTIQQSAQKLANVAELNFTRNVIYANITIKGKKVVAYKMMEYMKSLKTQITDKRNGETESAVIGAGIMEKEQIGLIFTL